MMHGVIRSAEFDALGQTGPLANIWRIARPIRWFLLFVMAPTLLATVYFYGFASNQYEASADFVVRRSETSGRSGLGIGQVLGFSLGVTQSQSEAYIVEEYLLSHDAVHALREKDQLVERFTRPSIDFLSGMWTTNPTPETLLKYYRKHVAIEQDGDSGITHLRVRAFSPEDSYTIAHRLLSLGEGHVNRLNERNFRDEIASSARQLASAERALTEAQIKLTAFRKEHGDIDPASSGKAQIGLVSGVSAQLVSARARLQTVGRAVSQNSPQYRALAAEVQSLEAQAAQENMHLAGSTTSIAADLGMYEDLLVRKEFASQRFTLAAASAEQARIGAIKQQIYVTRVVEPAFPVKSLYPARGTAIATVFFSLLMAYAIGWLLVAGVKEHSI